jgi:hypothetical protein
MISNATESDLIARTDRGTFFFFFFLFFSFSVTRSSDTSVRCKMADNVMNLHIFESNGTCLFSLHPDPEVNEHDRLLFGFLYSIRSFATKMSPSVSPDDSFLSFSTNAYRLFCIYSPTGLWFVMLIDRHSPSRPTSYFRQLLRDIHRDIWVEYHVKNAVLTPRPNKTIDSHLFRSRLMDFLAKTCA